MNSFLETREGPVVFAETDMNVCEIESRDVTGLRELLQLAQNLPGLLLLAPACIAVAHRRHDAGPKRTATTQGEGLVERLRCFAVAALPLMAQAQEPVGAMEIRVQLKRPAALCDAQVVFAAEVVEQAKIRIDRQRERVQPPRQQHPI